MVQLYKRKGVEILVNTSTNGFQELAQIEPLANGGFVAIWADRLLDGTDAEVRAQLFDANGNKVGGEFQVNTTSAAFQSNAKVAALSSGRFAIIWEDTSGTGGDSSFAGLKGQLFEANGTKVGGEFLVNSTVTDSQWLPAVTELAGGGFVVTWTDQSLEGGDTSISSIKGQVFDSSAAKVGGEFLVNSTTAGNQLSPAVAQLANGGFVVSWGDFSGADGEIGSGIRLQRFDGAGARVGAEVHVNSVVAGSQSTSAIAVLSGGGFVVTWTDGSRLNDVNGNGIKGQLFDAAGAKVGGEFLVNMVTQGDQFTSRVSALPGGGFVVTWTSGSTADPSLGEIKAQVFDASANRVGTEFLVNSTTLGEQSFSSIAALPSGDIVISWTDRSNQGSDTSGSAVKMQILTFETGSPTDIGLSNTIVSETAISNFAIAQLNAVGAVNSSFTYAVISDSTGGGFRIDGDRLVVADNTKLDFETAPTAEVRIRATDLNGQSYEETFTLTLADAESEYRFSASDPFASTSAAGESHLVSMVALLADDRSLMIWTKAPPNALYGQLQDASGDPIGDPFDLGIQMRGFSNRVLLPLPSGGFVVVYEGSSPDSLPAIIAQFFDAAGAKAGSPVTVSTSNEAFTSYPAATLLDSGVILVTWTRDLSSSADVVGQRLTTSGTKLGGEFDVNGPAAGEQGLSDVAALADGEFLVTWSDFTGVHGQRFAASGAKDGPALSLIEERATLYTTELAAMADDSFVLLVVDTVPPNEGGPYGLAFQRFDSSGQEVGDEIFVTNAALYPTAKIAALPGDGFVVSWQDLSNRLMVQVFNTDGSPAGSAFVANADVGGEIADPSMFVSATGDLILGWTQVVYVNGSFSRSYVVDRRFDLVGGSTLGTSGNDIMTGTSGDDMFDALAGNDQLFLQQGGDDEARGGDGNDGIYFGAALDGNDAADGGAGIDTLVVQGNYANLALNGITNVEVLLVASGADTRFGDTAGNRYDYVIAAVDSNVPAGSQLTVIGSELLAGEDLTFNGAAETNGRFRIFAGRGTDNLTGGAGGDGFFFGADGNLTGADRVNGGGGTDSIALRGNYVGPNTVVFQDASFTNVEVLTFLSGHTNEFGGAIDTNGFDYDLTLANGNIAAGQRLDVIASNLRANESARVDARAELDGSVRILAGAGNDTLFGSAGNDTLYGGLGADALDGSGGSDTYVYRALAESTAASRDTIAFASGDKIDLSLIDASTAAAGNEAFSFLGSAAFSNVAGQLRAAQSGGQWIVEGDVNGDGIADLAIAVTSATALTATDFVL